MFYRCWLCSILFMEYKLVKRSLSEEDRQLYTMWVWGVMHLAIDGYALYNVNSLWGSLGLAGPQTYCPPPLRHAFEPSFRQ